MKSLSRWLLIAAVVLSPAARDVAFATAPPAADVPLDDPIEPLAPKQRRSEAEQDRVAALALYSAARSAEQKENYAEALRLYQRAYRSDPSSPDPLRQIVPLAFRLNRQAEGVRYALLQVELDDSNPDLMHRLAMYLTQDGDAERAMRLYDRVIKLQANQKPSPDSVQTLLEAGRLFFLAKKYDRAADHLARVAKALDKPGEEGLTELQRKRFLDEADVTYYLIGETLLEAGRYDEAAAAFDKSHQIKPDAGLLAFNQARLAARRSKWDEALAKLQGYFDAKKSDEGTAPYELLAEALKKVNQSDQLISRLEKLHEPDKENIALAYFLAQQYRAAKQLDKAEPIYTQLIESHKSRPPIEAYQGLIDVYLQSNRADKLLQTLGDALSRTGTLALLGEEAKSLSANETMQRSLQELARERHKADAKAPGFGASLALALLASKGKAWDTATEFYNMALEAEPKRAPEVVLGWGLDLLMAERYADAAKILKRGLDEKLVPDTNAAMHFFLAGAYEMSGQTDAALASARRAAELQKDSARNASRVAWILYHAKRYDDSKKAYQELLKGFGDKQEPAETRETLRDARMVLSNIAVLQNKLPESEDWIEQVLDEYPEDVGAMNDLGYLWADQNKHLQRALAMVQKAVAAEPKNGAYRDSLGWALYRVGKYAEAVAELKTAATGEKPDAVVLDHLGDALLKSGDRGAAVDAWTRAVKAFQDEKDDAKLKATQEKIDREKSQSSK